MWNSTQWRAGMQQAVRNGSISHSGTSGAIAGSWTFTVDESARCSSVKESKQGCISYCNKPQVILYMDGWKDLLSSVSLFGLAMLQLLDDCSCEIWRSCTVELTLTPPDQMTGDKSQTIWSSLWLALLSCGCCRIWRFVVDWKHLARPGITYTFIF